MSYCVDYCHNVMLLFSLDSQSGSIRDSEPNSPRSPQSPTSPSSPAEPDKPMSAASKSSINVVHAASSALQGLSVSGNVTYTYFE